MGDPAHGPVRHARPADLLANATAAGSCGRTRRSAKVAAAPKPRERERPQLNLVGTIAGGDEGFGIFLDQSTKARLRLKVGEDYQGWKAGDRSRGERRPWKRINRSLPLELPQPGFGPTPASIEVRNEVRSPPSGTVGKLLSITSQPRPDRAGR